MGVVQGRLNWMPGSGARKAKLDAGVQVSDAVKVSL